MTDFRILVSHERGGVMARYFQPDSFILCINLFLVLLAGCDAGVHVAPARYEYVLPAEDRQDVGRLLMHLQSPIDSESGQAMTCLLALPDKEVLPQLIGHYQAARLTTEGVGLRIRLVEVFARFHGTAFTTACELADDYCTLALPESTEQATQLRVGIIAALAAIGDIDGLFPHVYHCLTQSPYPNESIELLNVLSGLSQPVELTGHQREFLQQRLIDGLAFAAADVRLTAKLLPATTWLMARISDENGLPDPLRSAIDSVILSLDERLSHLMGSEPPEKIQRRRRGGRRRRSSYWTSNPDHTEWSAMVAEVERQRTSFLALDRSAETDDGLETDPSAIDDYQRQNPGVTSPL